MTTNELAKWLKEKSRGDEEVVIDVQQTNKSTYSLSQSPDLIAKWCGDGKVHITICVDAKITVHRTPEPTA